MPMHAGRIIYDFRTTCQRSRTLPRISCCIW